MLQPAKVRKPQMRASVESQAVQHLMSVSVKKLTSASVCKLDRVCQVSCGILLALPAFGPVVTDQLGIYVHVCHIVDDTANLEA